MRVCAPKFATAFKIATLTGTDNRALSG